MNGTSLATLSIVVVEVSARVEELSLRLPLFVAASRS